MRSPYFCLTQFIADAIENERDDPCADVWLDIVRGSDVWNRHEYERPEGRTSVSVRVCPWSPVCPCPAWLLKGCSPSPVLSFI